jgi:hypothetical protein
MADGVKLFNPATNQVEELPADQAQEGFVQGKYHLPNQGEVHLSSPDGTTMIFPTAKAPDLVSRGWRFSNPEQIAQKTVDDSPLQQAQGAVEGALSQLTFGASDAAIRAAGGDRNLLQARRESGAGQAGEAIGLGTALFGELGLKLLGEGVAKTALHTALAPTLATQAAGDAVESMASKVLGDTLTSNAVAHTVATGLGRAAEGAVYGFGGQLSEEALGDPQINAANLAAGTGLGALLGGVAGAGLRGLSEYRAGRVARASDEAIAANRAAGSSEVGKKFVEPFEAPTPEEFQQMYSVSTGEKLPEGGMKRWFGMVKDAINEKLNKASEVAGYDPADLAQVNGPEGQKWLRAGKSSVEDAARGFRNVIDRVADEQAASSDAYFGKLKGKALDLIPAGSQAAVLSRAGDALDQVRAIRDEAVDNWAAYGFRSEEHAASAFKNMDGLVDRAEDRLFKAANAPREVTERRVTQLDGGGTVEVESQRKLGLRDLADGRAELPDDISRQAFEELEDVKRRIAKPANFALAGDINDVAQKDLEKQFQRAYGVMKDHLEDSSVWGGMGDVQKQMNDAWKARNDAFGALKRQLKFDREGHVDPAAVAGYISKLDKVRGDAVVEALDNWHAAQNSYASVIDKHFSAANIGEKSRALSKEFATVRQGLEDGAATFNALQRLIGKRYQQFGGSGLGGGVVGGAVGAALGPLGAAGAFAGNQVLQAILDPGRRAINMAALSNATEKVGAWVEQRSKLLIDGKKAIGRAVSGPFGTRAISRFTTAMLEAKSPEQRRKAYDRRIEELSSLDDPQQFGDHVATQLLGMTDHLPNHAQALTAQAGVALNYLRTIRPNMLPGTGGAGGPFDTLYAKPRPHDRDILKFAQADQAVQDPMSIYDSAEKGYVFSHQLQAVEAVHPHLMQAVRSSLVTRAGYAKAPPPSSRSRVLGQLLGGTAVPAAKLQRIQQVHQMAGASQGGQSAGSSTKSTPKVKTPRSAGMAPTTDKLENYPL